MAALSALDIFMGILEFVPTGVAAWLLVPLLLVWIFNYQVSIGACAFVLLGEVSTPPLRAMTTALATATQSMFSVVLNLTVPFMINPDATHMGFKIGFIHGSLGAISTLICFFYIPELKGRTFQEIDIMFHSRVPPRKMGQYQV